MREFSLNCRLSPLLLATVLESFSPPVNNSLNSTTTKMLLLITSITKLAKCFRFVGKTHFIITNNLEVILTITRLKV